MPDADGYERKSLTALGMDEKNDARLRGKDTKLRQQYGLALAQCSCTKAAQEVLLGLYREKARDEGSLGIVARTYKDQWLAKTNEDCKLAALRACIRYYKQAWNLSDGYWTGINVATVSVLAGRHRAASRVAQVGKG